jgi:hypothetical protein
VLQFSKAIYVDYRTLEWIRRKPLTMLENAADWHRILAVLDWFRDHPRSGLYLRQLDIAAIDSKFIEGRRGLLAELLDVVQSPQMDEPPASQWDKIFRTALWASQ